MARLPYVDPESAPEGVREILARPEMGLRIFRLVAHAETGFRPFLRFGASVLAQQALPGLLRELAILRVARLSGPGAEYEWVQHVPIAKATGASDAQIEALDAGRIDAPAFGEAERAVLAFTTELVRDVRPSDAALAALRRHLSPREVVELVLAVGWYMLIARLMATADIDLDPPAGTGVVEAARREPPGEG